MRWIEPKADLNVSRQVTIPLLLQTLAKRPANSALRARLGDEYIRCRRYGDALTAYELAAEQSPRDFVQWSKLAMCYLELGDPVGTLKVCNRSENYATEVSADIEFQRGRALRRLGRYGEASEAFLSALHGRGRHFEALEQLLAPLAMEPNGDQLLRFCETLPPLYRNGALALANRAIALSRLGRTDEALQIVNLERHVARVQFVPGAQFGSVEHFNSELAGDILAERHSSIPARTNCEVNYAPGYHRSRALSALRVFIRNAFEQYVCELKERELDTVMPPPPSSAKLYAATVILHQNGHNGEHVHADSYISAVYHVLVPDSVVQADDHRGNLALGRCERYTGGYTPCWGTRLIKPVAGWLIIFPSHMYHDVIPSHADSPRISVAADLRPVS